MQKEQDSSSLYYQFMDSTMRLHRAMKHLPPPDSDLNHFEYHLLGRIGRYQHQHPDLPGIQISALCRELMLSRSSMSQHLRQIESRGYIERVPDRNDRRVTYLRLSDTAQRKLREIREKAMSNVMRICDTLGPEDTKTAVTICDRIREIIQDLSETGSSDQQNGRGCCF